MRGAVAESSTRLSNYAERLSTQRAAKSPLARCSVIISVARALPTCTRTLTDVPAVALFELNFILFFGFFGFFTLLAWTHDRLLWNRHIWFFFAIFLDSSLSLFLL